MTPPLRPWTLLRSLGLSASNLARTRPCGIVHERRSCLSLRLVARRRRPLPALAFRHALQRPFLRFFAPSAVVMGQVFRSQLPSSANRRLAPVFERVQGSFALFTSSCFHLPGLFHPGAALGVLPSEVCPGSQPDTFRLALPCFPFTVRIDLAIVFVGVSPADRLATLRRLVVLTACRPCARFHASAVEARVSPHAGIPGL